jgi:hypothetical protein
VDSGLAKPLVVSRSQAALIRSDDLITLLDEAFLDCQNLVILQELLSDAVDFSDHRGCV